MSKKHRGHGRTFNNSLTELVSIVGAMSGARLSSYNTIAYSANTALITTQHIMLAYLYVNNGIFQAAVQCPIQDALSKGIIIKSDELDDNDIDQILEYMDYNGLWQTIIDFETWRNVYGGAALIINTPAEPSTRLQQLKKGQSFELYDADRWQMTQSQATQNAVGFYEQDPNELKEFNVGGVRIHHSRVIIGKGKRVPWLLRSQMQGWGMSEAERMIRDLNNYLKTQNVLYEILDESKIDVYHVKGLFDAMKTGQVDKVAVRVQRANELKNYLNALVLDLEEKFETKSQTFAGLAEVMNENRIGIAAALRRPMTKLFGLSPSGFSNGDSDLDTYYQLVESDERAFLKPVIRKVVDLVCGYLFGYVPNYKLEFPPLKQMSEKDQEEIKNHKLDRIIKMLDAQLLNPTEAVEVAKKENLLDIETAIERGILPSGDEPPEANTDKVVQIERTNSLKKNDNRIKIIRAFRNDAEFESKHPRQSDGKFGAGGSAEPKPQKKPNQEITDKNAKEIKTRLDKKFDSMAVPMKIIEFSRENYDKLFPDGKVKTPLGEVKMGEHQFEKLQQGRQELLDSMHKTLSDPIAVISEKQDGKWADIYVKSFKGDNKLKGVESVVVDQDGIKVSISTHRRNKNNILNKIRSEAKLTYERLESLNALGSASSSYSKNTSGEASNIYLLTVYHILE
ncbi:putative phage portal protein [Candidatus Termititenax aidoneus]|uniref:Phage portal protein n=1 Tax=Termititenax aidoneus TaxID=2218524 RepID=A0A388TC35_TERA1|nr:putative phage portal protein [Candidatus Termititenax aidoneus]